MAGPTDDKIIRIDMTDQSVTIADFPEEWKLLGGRALSAKILLNECDHDRAVAELVQVLGRIATRVRLLDRIRERALRTYREASRRWRSGPRQDSRREDQDVLRSQLIAARA